MEISMSAMPTAYSGWMRPVVSQSQPQGTRPSSAGSMRADFAPPSAEKINVSSTFNFLRERALISVDGTKGELAVVPASSRLGNGQYNASGFYGAAADVSGIVRPGALLNTSG